MLVSDTGFEYVGVDAKGEIFKIFNIFVIFSLILMKFPQHFYKSIVCHVCYTTVAVKFILQL